VKSPELKSQYHQNEKKSQKLELVHFYVDRKLTDESNLQNLNGIELGPMQTISVKYIMLSQIS
jgi:hypothetical protein